LQEMIISSHELRSQDLTAETDRRQKKPVR